MKWNENKLNKRNQIKLNDKRERNQPVWNVAALFLWNDAPSYLKWIKRNKNKEQLEPERDRSR